MHMGTPHAGPLSTMATAVELKTTAAVYKRQVQQRGIMVLLVDGL